MPVAPAVLMTKRHCKCVLGANPPDRESLLYKQLQMIASLPVQDFIDFGKIVDPWEIQFL